MIPKCLFFDTNFDVMNFKCCRSRSRCVIRRSFLTFQAPPTLSVIITYLCATQEYLPRFLRLPRAAVLSFASMVSLGVVACAHRRHNEVSRL